MYLDYKKNSSDYYIIDIESNGLNPTQLWCAVAKNIGSGEFVEFDTEAMYDGRFKRFVEAAPVIVGHNYISYDNYHTGRLIDTSKSIDKIVDTLMLSFLYHPYLPGGHSLEAYGERFNVPKLDHSDWDHLSPQMMARCRRDVELTEMVYKGLCERMNKIGYSEKSAEIEHRIRDVIDRQTRRGFHFNRDGATSLITDISDRLRSLEGPIKELFPPVLTAGSSYRYRTKRDGTPYDTYNRHRDTHATIRHSTDNSEYTVYDYESFDIGSPKQRVEKLLSLGWEPTEFTPGGSPKVNEEALKQFADSSGQPTIRSIADWVILNSRRSTLESWLRFTGPDSRIHGQVFTCGAITRRMRHNNPNCVPLYSQALTRDGWKSWNQLVVGEDILAYDMETHTKKWTPLLNVSAFPEAEVYSLGQKHPSKRLYCTKNHSWVTTQRDVSGNRSAKERLVEAKDLCKNSRVRINAPFDNDVTKSGFTLIQEKYEHDWESEICKLSDPELAAMMQGFLLADGCRHGKSWTFAQAEGPLLDAFLTCLYLISDTRISACQKRPLRAHNQRMGYNVVQTGNTFMRTKDMSLRYEGLEPVWCPTTKFGTWVMKQGDFISITGNTANIPSEANGAFMGAEMRSLWDATPGRILMGYDASGLEMRGFLNYVWPNASQSDKDMLWKLYIDGKPHQHNADALTDALGFPVVYGGGGAKTLFYAFLYGAGDPKLGRTLNKGPDVGKKVRKALMSAVPGLEGAVKGVQDEYNNGGLIRTIDGGYVRGTGEHSAFNSQVQSAGGIVMKEAAIIFDKKITDLGLDIWKVGDIHDESQQDCGSTEEAVEGGKAGTDAIREAGESLGFNVPLAGEYKIGVNWHETH